MFEEILLFFLVLLMFIYYYSYTESEYQPLKSMSREFGTCLALGTYYLVAGMLCFELRDRTYVKVGCHKLHQQYAIV